MEILGYSQIDSPIGPLTIAVSDFGVTMLAFGQQLPVSLAGKPVRWGKAETATASMRDQLSEYFAGRRRQFSVPLDLRGTDFQRRCWQQLLEIPYGKTRSYADIARAVGSPRGFRAVGQANHHNPVAIVVPCHRVLAGGRALGGYGGGLRTKAFLLRLEGAEFLDEAPRLAFHE
jgi:methylated-DNA-[protein]-cysteine S-methyltransferase